MGVQHLIITDEEAYSIFGILDSCGCGANNRAYQLYTARHKFAFMITQYALFGQISESAYYHDVDKLVMYGLVGKGKLAVTIQLWHYIILKTHVQTNITETV